MGWGWHIADPRFSPEPKCAGARVRRCPRCRWSHATEIEDDLLLFFNVPDQARKRGGLVTVDDAALAVNDDHIAAISSFQTEFQRRLLKLNSEARHVLRQRPCCQVLSVNLILLDRRSGGVWES